MTETIFLKLGGSLLTDKRGVEKLRPGVLARVAAEIRAALDERPELRLVLGHGSGSFGHVAAERYRTREGVQTEEAWQGFAQVAEVAGRLNGSVCAALLEAGVPAISLQPSASARCRDGLVVEMAVEPLRLALTHRLVPLVYGDVAFDQVRGGTIISTEEVLGYLAGKLTPTWFLLAGETAGVYDLEGRLVPQITAGNYERIAAALGGSRGSDVTGGMASKVRAMLDLTGTQPGLSVRIFSGLEPGAVTRHLLSPAGGSGTFIGEEYR